MLQGTRRRGHRKSGAALAVSFGILLWAVNPAGAATVQNGSFETGTFADWTEADTGQGAWYVYSGTTTPIQQQQVPAPACGDFAAVSDQAEPSAMVLYQDIALEAGYTHSLTFQHFYLNDPPSFVGQFFTPDTLSIAVQNQQYRIDIMDPTADPYSVAAGDVWDPVFRTNVGDPPTTGGWQPMSVDLSAFAGQTVRLRYAVAVTEDGLFAGVDCVQVASEPIPTTTTSTPTTTQVTPATVTPAFTG